jgi:hypothetical protein
LVPEKVKGLQLANRTKPTNIDCVIILNSGSTIKATFKTESMVGNVKEANIPLEMNTNGGKVLVKKTEVWFDPNMMANILGLFHMTKEHRCTMDTAVENCINVHTPGGITKFKATPEGLYCWEPMKVYQREIKLLKKVGVCNLVYPVQEN